MDYALEYLAEAFNVEFVFLETGGTVEEILSKVESGLESGMDGLLSKPIVVDELLHTLQEYFGKIK